MHVQRLMDSEIIGETDEHSLVWPQLQVHVACEASIR